MKVEASYQSVFLCPADSASVMVLPKLTSFVVKLLIVKHHGGHRTTPPLKPLEDGAILELLT